MYAAPPIYNYSMRVLILSFAVGLPACVSPALPSATGPTASEVARQYDGFVQARSRHLSAYAEPGSEAAARLDAILIDRENSIAELERFFGVRLRRRLAIVFFASEESKYASTGHRGFGWAVNDVIVEVRNADTGLEPFHELSHIISGEIGSPPALFDEGAAVYVTERFGHDAMADFRHPGLSSAEAVAANIDAGHYVPITDVFAFTDIGPPETQALYTYPEAGSFLSFLVTRCGEQALREAFRTLVSSADPDQLARNEQSFERIFGMSLAQAERDWRIFIGRPL